jgi:hypothetical protein
VSLDILAWDPFFGLGFHSMGWALLSAEEHAAGAVPSWSPPGSCCSRDSWPYPSHRQPGHSLHWSAWLHRAASDRVWTSHLVRPANTSPHTPRRKPHSPRARQGPQCIGPLSHTVSHDPPITPCPVLNNGLTLPPTVWAGSAWGRRLYLGRAPRCTTKAALSWSHAPPL